MWKSLLCASARRFGARYDYDVGYMEDIGRESASAFLKLGLVTPFTSERFGLELAPYFAAKFVATRKAGCGPCVMLVVRMAEEAGVTASELAAIARPGPARADMRLAADFAEAVLSQSPELGELEAAALSRFGVGGRMGLAAAIATGQFYPLLKRGLGHAQSCAILPAEFREA
jgi:hypothetical protein